MRPNRHTCLALLAALIAGVASTQPAHAIATPVGSVISHWANTAPTIDGQGTSAEWSAAASFALPHGVLMAQNDEENLYLLVDMTGDTVNDAPKPVAPWGDYYWLSFDIDRNDNITPGVDTNYAPLFVPGFIFKPIVLPLPGINLPQPIVDITKILPFVPPIPGPGPIIKGGILPPLVLPGGGVLPGPAIGFRPQADPPLPTGAIMLPSSISNLLQPLPRVLLPPIDFSDHTRLTVQHYLGECEWTSVQDTASREATGFGASLNSGTPHRQYEFALKLTELNASPATWHTFRDGLPFVRFGLRTVSQTPAIDDSVPASFCNDFSHLVPLFLAVHPSSGPGTGLGRYFRGVGLIPRLKIDQTTGLATTDPGYYLDVHNAPFGGTLQIFGNWAFLRSLGAYKYRVLHRHQVGPGTWSGWEPITQSFGNYHLDPDDVLRLKTLSPTLPDGWYNLPFFGDDDNWYLRDLLVEWSSGADELEQFKVEVLRWFLGPYSPGDPDDSLTLDIVNTPPIATLTVKHGGAPVPPCAIVTLLPPPDGFTFDAYVHDNKNNLLSWQVWASGPLGGGAGCSSPAIGGGYDDDNSNPGNWPGPGDFTLPTTGTPPRIGMPGALGSPWRPTCTGCYEFHVQAWGRTTNGYTHTLLTDPDPIPVTVMVP